MNILRETLLQNKGEVSSHPWVGVSLLEGLRAGWCGQGMLCPGGSSVPLSSPGTSFCLSLLCSGRAGLSTRLRWEYKPHLPHFPPPGEDIPISSWAGPCFPSLPSQTPLPGPSCVLQLNPLSTSLHLLPFKASRINLLPYSR